MIKNDKKYVQIKLSKEAYIQARIMSVRLDRSLQSILEELIQRWISGEISIEKDQPTNEEECKNVV